MVVLNTLYDEEYVMCKQKYSKILKTKETIEY